MNEATLIMVSQDNLDLIAEMSAKRVTEKLLASKWLTPEETERMLNLKRQTILKLYENGEIDLTWPGMEGSKVWMASRSSIEAYLEKKRNYNLKK